MKKKHSILILTLCVAFSSYAQNSRFFAELNYNTFSHKKLKTFQDEFVADVTDVQLVKNDEFPANIGFTIGYVIEDTNIAIFVSHTSTGGKASYSDSTGLIRITEAVSGLTIGGEYLLDINKKKTLKGDLNLGLRTFLTISNLKVQSTSGLNGNMESSELKFSSGDFGVGLRAIYEYPIAFFSLRVSLGFDGVFAGKYLLKDNAEYHLEDNSGSPVKNGWSGLRTGLGISIPI